MSKPRVITSFHLICIQAIEMVRLAKRRKVKLEWVQEDFCTCHNYSSLSFQMEGFPPEAFHTVSVLSRNLTR